MFWPRAAAYMQRVSIDKYWLSKETAEFSLFYIESTFTLALGAALIVAAFVG